MTCAVSGPELVLVDGDEVVLLERDGRERWRRELRVRDLRWRDGALVAQLPGGNGVIDVNTGALVSRRCGSKFGVTTEPRTEMPDEESTCEAR